MNSKLGKSRRSNHKKKAWRHVDLSEIDQYLEDKELDERTGLTGQDEFYINKEGDDSNIKKTSLNHNLIDEVEKVLINDRSRTRQIIDNLKAHKSLQSTSAVPAFKPNKSVIQKRTPEETLRQSKRLDKVVKSLEQRRPRKEDKKNVKYDLWEEKDKTPIGDVYVDYAEDFEKVRLSRIFKCPSKQNPNVQKKVKSSLLPAVEPPHPGLSYNPDRDDHTDLLIAVGNRKKKEIKEKKKINKLFNQGFDPTVNVELENAKEMASGLFSESEEDEELNDEQTDEATDQPIIASDLKKRKSNKARRNELQHKIDMLRAKRRKNKKRYETEFTKIKHYVREAKAIQERAKLNRQIKKQRKIDKLYRPAKLGKEKYKDPEPEFCLESELNGSLRKINTDGNLLMDRFKSLQRRNLIEHRRVQLKQRSKAKRKRVIRNSIFNKDLFERDNPDN